MSGHNQDREHDADGGSHKKHKKHHHHGAHAEHEHEEGWIVSFADNVLLMMGFFVILLAMNMGPKGSSDAAPTSTAEDRLLDVAIAVREAFHNPVSMDSLEPQDQALIRRLRDRRKPGAGDAAVDGGEPAADGVENAVGGKGISNVRPSDWQGEAAFVQFDERQVLLSSQSKRTIAEVSRRLVDTRWMVEVRGHASKWETWRDTRKARDLAYERAWAVGNELVLNGVQWEQIRLVSSGTCAPVVARARSADEAETNQRTEILVLREHAPPDPYSNAPARPSEDEQYPD
ncbi:MAG: flagellar motor protein MotB [Phycisphaerales bacterium]